MFFLIFLLLLVNQASSKSYYDILHVKSKSSEHDIKQAYRELAKKFHPDKNKNDPNAQDKFIKITEAYEVLVDPQKRAEYDDSLSGKTRSSMQYQRQNFHDFNMHRAPRGFHQENFFMDQRGNRFTFTYSTDGSKIRHEPKGFLGSLFHTFMLILTALFATIPIFAILLPFFLIYLVCKFLDYIFSSIRYLVTPKPPPYTSSIQENTNIDQLPIFSKSLLQSSHKRIVIVALTSRAEKCLKNIERKFRKDPVRFCIQSSGRSDVAMDMDIVAFRKQGVECDIMKHVHSNIEAKDVEEWIVRILNGQGAWVDVTSADLPQFPDVLKM